MSNKYLYKPKHKGYDSAIEYACDYCGIIYWESKKAFEKKKGSLHQTLDVPKDEKISDTKMSARYGKSKDTDAKIRAAVNANPEEYPQTKAKIKAQSGKEDKK